MVASRVTREVLDGYLRCKTKGFLTLAGRDGIKSDYERWRIEAEERQSSCLLCSYRNFRRAHLMLVSFAVVRGSLRLYISVVGSRPPASCLLTSPSCVKAYNLRCSCLIGTAKSVNTVNIATSRRSKTIISACWAE